MAHSWEYHRGTYTTVVWLHLMKTVIYISFISSDFKHPIADLCLVLRCRYTLIDRVFQLFISSDHTIISLSISSSVCRSVWVSAVRRILRLIVCVAIVLLLAWLPRIGIRFWWTELLELSLSVPVSWSTYFLTLKIKIHVLKCSTL